MTISNKIASLVRHVPDFPKQGINFIDITPLLLDNMLANQIVESFQARLVGTKIDAIVGIESRGFLFGFLLANRLEVPFIPIRKSGKLPCETLKFQYELEYGFAEVEIHKQDVKKGWQVLIHDDLLATGGTACAAAELIQQLDAKVAGFAFVVALDFLQGKEKLKKYTSQIISLKDY